MRRAALRLGASLLLALVALAPASRAEPRAKLRLQAGYAFAQPVLAR